MEGHAPARIRHSVAGNDWPAQHDDASRTEVNNIVAQGVDIVSEEIGSGDVAVRGKTVIVRLQGTLRRGDVFMANQLCTFTVGARVAIAGLEYGVEGMRVGGRRRIRVPPRLGYREEGLVGKIPPNALLFFDLELLEVRD